MRKGWRLTSLRFARVRLLWLARCLLEQDFVALVLGLVLGFD